jgi:very-short-patch-repair endonuclease
VRVDYHFSGTPVIVELLGYRWHRSKDQLTRDAARMNALVLDGFVPMQFTYDHVTVEPEWVIEQTRHALHRL